MPDQLNKLKEIWDQLSPHAQTELLDFAKQLLEQEQERQPTAKYLDFSWLDALHDPGDPKVLGDQYTSVELQKQALELRIKSAMRGISNPDPDS
jgi:hypothetical protein